MANMKKHATGFSDADKILGHDWEVIQRAQRKEGSLSRNIDMSKNGDYGADPLGNGKFRMAPSGDIVDFEERNKRLER